MRRAALRDICTKIGSGATPKGGKEAYKSDGVSIIRSQNVLDFSFSENGLAFIDEEQAGKLENVIVEKNDVLLNITGDSVARVCSVPDWVLPARVNQHVAIVRADQKILFPNYLKYHLLSSSSKNQLLNLASSGATRNALTKSMIEEFEINLPPFSEQKTIAHILGTLDDKIELNRKMNETLEQMAQALFKSWFVDFDLVFDNAIAKGNSIPNALKHKVEQRNEVVSSGKYKTFPKEIMELFPSSFEFNNDLEKWIPEGWDVKSFGEEIMPKKGKNITKKDVVNGGVPVVAGGLKPSTYHNISNTNSPVITISASGANAGYVHFYHTPVWSSDSSFIDNSATDFVHFSYLYLKQNQKNIFDKQEGSAQPHIYPRHIASFLLAFPSINILKYFERFISIYYLKIKNNLDQNDKLKSKRDVLLPQLISGNLRVVKNK